MKNKLESNKGITLIALIITIIVLLILVGVTLAMVVGDNGIISKANKSASLTERKTIEEEYNLLVGQYKMEKVTNKSLDFQQFMLAHGASNVEREDNVYTVEYKGVIFTEIIGSPELIAGIQSISLTFDDLISSSELKITANVQFEEGASITINKYKFFVYEGSNLIAQGTSNESNWTANGLTPGTTYSIYVSVFDSAGLKCDSDAQNYTKLAVYAWNKYEANQELINYSYSYRSTCRLYNNVTYYEITEDQVSSLFNSSTGKWDTSSLTPYSSTNAPGFSYSFHYMTDRK